MQRGLLGLVAVGDQSSEQVDEEIVGTTMAGMLDLADVLELVIDALDDRTLAQQQSVGGGKDPFTHILAQLGDQQEALPGEELLSQRLGDGATIAKELAKEATHEARDGATVIGVARRQAERQQFATIVDDEVELEPREPAHGGLATTRIDSKDAMLGDPGIVTDGERGGVHEADPRATTQLRLQVDGERQQDTRDQGDEAGVAHQLGELGAQLGLDVVRVEAFECAVARLLEEDQNGHDLARTQLRRPLALAATCGQHFTLPQRFERLPERVHRAVQVEYTHAQRLQTG